MHTLLTKAHIFSNQPDAILFALLPIKTVTKIYPGELTDTRV